MQTETDQCVELLKGFRYVESGSDVKARRFLWRDIIAVAVYPNGDWVAAFVNPTSGKTSSTMGHGVRDLQFAITGGLNPAYLYKK